MGSGAGVTGTRDEVPNDSPRCGLPSAEGSEIVVIFGAAGGVSMRKFIVSAAVAIVIFAVEVSAQTTTGRLIGTVQDDHGAVLAGVGVTVESPALIGGPRSKTTDEWGEFAFIGLAPGDYGVRAELAGFIPQERAMVKVWLGGAAELTIVMPAGSFSGEIEVIDETPVVDPTQVNSGQVFDAAYMQESAIGSANRAYYSVIGQTAGTELTWFGGWAFPRVFGSTYSENAFYVDGVDTTTTAGGEFGFTLNFDAIQEIEFQTGGFEAEFGRATGGLISLVTRSGGNRFSGTFDARYRDSSFQESGEFFDADELDSQNRNIAVTLGGPAVRDTLWFFASWQILVHEDTPVASPATLRTEEQNFMGKLTWAISPAWRLSGRYTGNPWHTDNVNASQFVSPEATGLNGGDVDAYSGELNGVLSDSLLFNLATGRTTWGWYRRPMSGDSETIAHYNWDTNMDTGNYWYQYRYEERRDDVSADLTWFVDGLGGSHEIKGGVQYSRPLSEGGECYTGTTSTETCAAGDSGLFFEDIEYGGTVPYGMNEWLAAGMGSSVGSIRTAFAQDAWRVTRDLTLKVGLRYDAVEYRDNDGTRIADMAELQPRIGVAWDLSGDAKNVLRGSWGRYLHPASTSIPEFASTLPSPWFYWYSCSTIMETWSAEECATLAVDLGWDYRTDPDGWDPYGWVLAPWERYYTEPGVIDPGLRATFADELILAYEREVGPRSSIELTFVDKKTRDIFDDTCNGNWPTPSPDAACNYFVMASFPELRRDFEAFIVTYENRGVDWLTLLASYTYSKSEGSVEASVYQGVEADVFPWHFENRYGFLSDHRSHRVKLNGFLSFKGDWTIGFDGRWSSGFRWTPQADVRDIPEIRWGTYFVEPRGNREAKGEHQLDLQLSKGFNAGPVRLVLIGSVFNVVSSEQPTWVCDRISGCGGIEMGEPVEWQIPRRYEVGFRVEF